MPGATFTLTPNPILTVPPYVRLPIVGDSWALQVF